MAKQYAVRVGFREISYVERDFIVEAESEDEAIAKALARDVIDEGEDKICEPQGIDDIELSEWDNPVRLINPAA